MKKGIENNDFLTELGVDLIKKIIENDFPATEQYSIKKVVLTDKATKSYQMYHELLGYPQIPSELSLLDSFNFSKEINEVFELIDFGYVEEEEA